MKKNYDYAVFIGRFQILHNGHIGVIKRALKEAKHLIISVGSINQPIDSRNPFTYNERSRYIYSAIDQKYWDRITIIGNEDYYNESEWISSVRTKVQKVIDTRKEGKRVTLIGFSKDSTSYYLKLFPSWDTIEAESYKNVNNDIVSSTPLRERFFEIGRWDTHSVPRSMGDYLFAYKQTEEYRKIVEEDKFIRKYKESWDKAPFPPIFVTVDSVVIVGGHVLLIRRKAMPGKGLFAIPGGFINPEETLVNAMIRELREETKIKVPEPVLRGSIVYNEVFDNPNRSRRGRTITHAYLIHLKNEKKLPNIKGSDDADKAIWVPIDALDSNTLFEDHYRIIKKMVKNV
jgi:bifunctional NMN adenylyltransferase/nudix hydrolase